MILCAFSINNHSLNPIHYNGNKIKVRKNTFDLFFDLVQLPCYETLYKPM